MTEQPERFDEATGPIDAHTPPSDGEEMAAIDNEIYALRTWAQSAERRTDKIVSGITDLTATMLNFLDRLERLERIASLKP